MELFENLKNKIDFYIRKKTRFSRQGYFEEPENLSNIFSGKLKQRENDLMKKYGLEYLSNMTELNYRENLYMLDILDKYFDIINQKDISALDIGCKNWNYVKGQYTFFKKHCTNLSLKGIEIDAYRLYWNLYSRYEVAKFYKNGLKNVKYIPKDFLNYDEKFDYLTWFLPFVRKYPHMRWGLPLEFFNPKKMLWHAYFSLKTGGKLFIVNQSEVEYDIQKDLLNECAIPFKEIGEIKSDFLEHNYKRFALVVTKMGPDDNEWLKE